MPDYLTLCQTLRRELGVEGTGPASVVSQTGIYDKLVNWVKSSDRSIQLLYKDWKFLWNQYSTALIPATSEYVGPADLRVWDTESVYLDYNTNQSRRLRYIPYKEWRQSYRQGAKTDTTPVRFTILPNNTLKVDPAPDVAKTLTADYWANPTDLAGNTDVSPIPEVHHRIIILRAKLYYAEEEEFPDLYQKALAEYQDLLAKLESDQLPGQENRARSEGEYLVVRPE